MALANTAAAHIVDAMESDLTPRNNNPLKDKVVHADIVVHGIDDIKTESKRDETSAPLVEQPLPSLEDDQDQARAEEMRIWWNNEMKKHMNQPDGYADVAVLLIKWADELDDMETKEEAAELESLFRDQFHYDTKTVELNVRKKPQLQLDNHVSEFLLRHDDPHNLLIVYYTGHGSFHNDKKFLELSASVNPKVCQGLARDAKANWNKVEEKLRDEGVEGDVLTILDTCYASNLVKKSGNQETKKFELMAASSIDVTTSSPGEYSFTRALINGLKELLDAHMDPISTFRLVQTINLNKKRSDTPAHVWARNQNNDQHIFLAPLKLRMPDVDQPTGLPSAPGGYLTLKFGLKNRTLDKDQIEYMTKALSKALLNKPLIGLRKLEWLGMRPAPPTHFDRVALIMWTLTQWKRVARERMQARGSQMGSQKMMLEDTDRTNACKRKHEAGDETPNAKRQYLDPSQPPSPPVSNASPRVDL